MTSATPKTVDVIVVGAGLAGLTAAYRLAKQGVDVVVLEADQRPGGRVLTAEYDAMYAEAGGAVVTGDEELLVALLEEVGIDQRELVELGLHGVDFTVGSRILHMARMDGRLGSPADVLHALRFGLATWCEQPHPLPPATPSLFLAYRRAIREIGSMAPQIEVPYRPDLHPEWDETSFGRFLDGFHPHLKHYFDLQLTVTSGASADHISLFWGIVTFKWNLEGGFYWVRGGMSRLPIALAQALGERLVLGSQVLSVNRTEPVEVVARSTDGERTLTARSVLIATPPAQASELTRDLPKDKEAALRQAPLGAYLPLHLRFSSRFWLKRWSSTYLNTSGMVFHDLVDATRGQAGTDGILMCFIGGPTAAELMTTSDEKVLEHVLRDLERLFPSAPSDLLGYRVFRWRNAIPYFPPNHARALELLRAPDGPRYFCGDYTQGAGMHDAVLSGELAARAIAQSLREPALDSVGH